MFLYIMLLTILMLFFLCFRHRLMIFLKNYQELPLKLDDKRRYTIETDIRTRRNCIAKYGKQSPGGQ